MAEDRDKQSMGASRSLAAPSVRLSYSGQMADGSWFGPLAPMQPTAPPDVKGRILDYASGYNLNVRPKAYEPVTFEQLRGFADSYDLLRLVIETRKDQVAALRWNLAPREHAAKKADDEATQARIQEIKAFFVRPDKQNFWDDWLRMILEDLFVLDAPSVFRRRTFGGELYALQPIDGATIKRVIDSYGNTPEPPYPAYQQVLKGFPAVDYTTEELLYRPRNKRTHRVYGYSPVEQIVMTVNIGIRRQVWQLQSFTEGNIPEALIGTPATWTPDQIRAFQDWFDGMLEGNTATRRKARFVPGEVAKGFVSTKPDELFGEAEEWLARVVCYAFSVSPQALLKMMNRATAETAQETAQMEGLAPIQKWVKGFMDTILMDDFGEPDLEFIWAEEDELDPNVKSQIIDREQAAGRLTMNEARKEQGRDPIKHPDADRPMFKTATGWTPIFKTPEEEAEAERMRAQIAGEVPGGEDDEDAPPGPDQANATNAPADSEEDTSEDLGKAAGAQQRVPAGSSKGGQFASGKAGGFSASDWHTAPATGFVGGKGSAKEQIDREVKNAVRRSKGNAAITGQTQAENLKSTAANHRRISSQHAETAQRWADQGHFDTAAQVMGSSKFQSMYADALEARADRMGKADEPEDMGVADDGDRPFVEAHGSYVDVERDLAVKAQKRLLAMFTTALLKAGKKAAALVRSKKLGKADGPEDDIDIDAILNELELVMIADMADDIADELLVVYGDSAMEALAQVGATTRAELVEVVNERALSWATRYAADLVGVGDGDFNIPDATRDMLRQTIAKGIADNLSTEDIADRIAQSYAFSAERAETIAMTEVASANSMGALEGYEEAERMGIKTKKSWLILGDACGVCHSNADAGQIELDESFPSGDMAPPAHPHCRCVLVPHVIEGDDE